MTGRTCAARWEISINQGSSNATSPAGPEQPAPPERWTIRRLLEWTTGFFADSGASQPRLDAEILLAEALGCQRIILYTRFDEEPDEATRARFRDWVSRHAKGEPVAYLVGHREFFSLKFQVSRDVLIPRPETEHVVSEAIDFLSGLGRPSQVAEIGTGSGIIAVTIAKHVAHASVVATDISPAALAIAKENAAAHGVTGRIVFAESDLLEAVRDPERFDLIVSNPPYIGTDEKGTVQPSVVNYEPHMALFAGADGCEVISRIISMAPARLVPGGRLVLEVSPLIAERVRRRIAEAGDFSDVRLVRDLAGLSRVIVATRK